MLIDDLKMRLRVKYNNKVIVGTFGFEDLNNVVESVAREVCNEMRMANVKGSDTHEKLHMMVIAYQDIINQCEVNNDTNKGWCVMDREDVIKKIRKGLNESLDNENIFRIADLFIAELEKAKREARVEVAEEIKEAIRENNNE